MANRNHTATRGRSPFNLDYDPRQPETVFFNPTARPRQRFFQVQRQIILRSGLQGFALGLCVSTLAWLVALAAVGGITHV